MMDVTRISDSGAFDAAVLRTQELSPVPPPGKPREPPVEWLPEEEPAAPVPGNPLLTIQQARRLRTRVLPPENPYPSVRDLQIASRARQMELKALLELEQTTPDPLPRSVDQRV